MYVQIVNFELDGMDEGGYQQLCDGLAPAFSGMEGLLSKLWLADSGSGTYGGVYLWRSSEACEAYKSSQIWSDVGAHPNLVNIRSQEFEVMDAPTALTSGPLATV